MDNDNTEDITFLTVFNEFLKYRIPQDLPKVRSNL